MKPLAPILVAVALAACRGGPDTESRLLARQQTLDPPALWLLEDFDAAGRRQSAAFACADGPMRQTFARIHAEVAGTPCRDISLPVVRPGLTTERCEVDGHIYVFTTQAAGDQAQDFRLTVTVTPIGGESGLGRETRHYRRMGACPAGWRVGDEANALAKPPAAGSSSQPSL
jgi:hypothetical protein